jgi:predicted RNA-binding protein with PIN domain
MSGGATPLIVLVDARNVLRSQWPNIPEDELVELCAAWAETQRARAVVVFDAEAPGGLVGEKQVTSHCRVVGTGSESADDWLVRAAAELRAEQNRFWLVTSDRALRELAGVGAEKTVGGGTFARELKRGAGRGG